jgi:hypothetical protein
MEAMVLIFLVLLTAASGFRIMSASLERIVFSSRLMSAAAAAEHTLETRRLTSRSALNPGGDMPVYGEEEELVHLEGTIFRITIRKEEVESCPGLTRWYVSAKTGSKGPEGVAPGEVLLLAGSFDPFQETGAGP